MFVASQLEPGYQSDNAIETSLVGRVITGNYNINVSVINKISDIESVIRVSVVMQ